MTQPRQLLLVSWDERCGGDLTIGESRLPLWNVLATLERPASEIMLTWPTLDRELIPLLRQLVREVRLAIEGDDGPSRRLQAIRELLEEDANA